MPEIHSISRLTVFSQPSFPFPPHRPHLLQSTTFFSLIQTQFMGGAVRSHSQVKSKDLTSIHRPFHSTTAPTPLPPALPWPCPKTVHQLMFSAQEATQPTPPPSSRRPLLKLYQHAPLPLGPNTFSHVQVCGYGFFSSLQFSSKPHLQKPLSAWPYPVPSRPCSIQQSHATLPTPLSAASCPCPSFYRSLSPIYHKSFPCHTHIPGPNRLSVGIQPFISP